jgi:hypothetical protein
MTTGYSRTCDNKQLSVLVSEGSRGQQKKQFGGFVHWGVVCCGEIWKAGDALYVFVCRSKSIKYV